MTLELPLLEGISNSEIRVRLVFVSRLARRSPERVYTALTRPSETNNFGSRESKSRMGWLRNQYKARSALPAN